ncbi:MAG: glycosyltransferase [Planctomycetes bacterium]|nr:glycosyltransferase [Planctomycetota bacterium]
MATGPRRILYLITELDPGGAEKSLYQIAVRLDRARFAPYVASLTGDGEVGRWLAARGVPVIPLEMRHKLDLRAFRRLVLFLREQRIEILHTFLFHANLLGRLAARVARTPVVVSAVRVAEGERGFHLVLDHWTSGLVDVVTTNAPELTRFTRRVGRIPDAKLVTIPNGVDWERYAAPGALAAALPGDPGDRRIIAIGRLSRQKGLCHLVRAFATVAAREARARLVLVGRGEEEAALTTEVAALPAGARGRVDFLGWRADVPALLAQCEVLALPSLWEGMPNVVLEAMAAGKPVVASAVGGAVDLVRAGENGFLAPPADPERLAAALLTVFDDPARAAAMGRAGQERVRREFTWDAAAAAHMRLYDALTGRRAFRT